MKLLLFSDIHTNKNYCENLFKMSAEADLLIGAGDFGSLRTGINKVIGWLSIIKKPAIVVPGNAESFDELKKACKVWSSAIPLHGNGIEIDGNVFFGLGGGIPVTPFGSWSYDFTEDEAKTLLDNCPPNVVLISHSPPYGFVDISSRGSHLGSHAIRKFLEEKTPKLVICGHIHESGGKTAMYENIVILNAGPEGMYYEMEW